MIPIILPTEVNPKLFARHLIESYGIWVSPVWFIARPRLRVTVNALHTKEETDRFVDALVGTRTVFGYTTGISGTSDKAKTVNGPHDHDMLPLVNSSDDQTNAGIDHVS